MGRKTLGVVAVALASAALIVGLAGPASAAGPGGAESCPSGSFCVYYNSPQYGWGSFENFSGPANWSSLSGFTFAHWGNGAGYGQGVEYNIASVVNNTGATWNLCAGSGTGAPCQPYGPNFAGGVASWLHDAETSLYSN